MVTRTGLFMPQFGYTELDRHGNRFTGWTPPVTKPFSIDGRRGGMSQFWSQPPGHSVMPYLRPYSSRKLADPGWRATVCQTDRQAMRGPSRMRTLTQPLKE